MKKCNQITNSHIPSEVIDDILMGVPLKSLARFTLLSKHWCEQITRPSFARAHFLKHQKDNAPELISYEYNEEQNRSRILIMDVNKDIVEGFRTQITINSPVPGNLRFRSTCHGILCFDDGINLILLWNPITNWYRTIAFPQFLVDNVPVIGFGYDASTQDYKLVFMHSEVVQVQSLKSNSWRKGCDVFPYAGMYDFEKAVHVNGILYWLVPGPNFIGFDLRTERFKKVEKPPTYEEFSLSTWDGKLMVVEPAWFMFEVSRLWLMEEDSNWLLQEKFCIQSAEKGVRNTVKKITFPYRQLLKFRPRIVDYIGSFVSTEFDC